MAFELRSARALGLSVRPIAADDSAFLLSLYASVRAPEFAALGWPEAILGQFLAQQEQFQQIQYRSLYPDAERLIIEREGAPIGRIYIDSRKDSLMLVDISLMPASRGLGLGGSLLQDLVEQAEVTGKPILLNVARGNRARMLYERLGFLPISGDDVYDEMRRESGVADGANLHLMA